MYKRNLAFCEKEIDFHFMWESIKSSNIYN